MYLSFMGVEADHNPLDFWMFSMDVLCVLACCVLLLTFFRL